VYWLNVADRSIPPGAIVAHTNFVPPEHYRSRHIAYLFAYLGADAPAFDPEADGFVSQHFPHVRRIFPDFRDDQVEDRFVFRTRYATPVYGHPYERPPIEPLSGLWLADTSRIYPMDRGTSECVRLASYVSARILRLPATEPGPI
jgi:protoporphyrinogen oxidase